VLNFIGQSISDDPEYTDLAQQGAPIITIAK